jgi:hypothetical protein
MKQTNTPSIHTCERNTKSLALISPKFIIQIYSPRNLLITSAIRVNVCHWLRCRNRDFASIIPHQPARYRERHNEVFLDFEAFLLSNMRERSTLWIHSQIKACMDATDCQPVSVPGWRLVLLLFYSHCQFLLDFCLTIFSHHKKYSM